MLISIVTISGARGIWRMVDNLDLLEGSDGWAGPPGRDEAQRQQRLGTRRERCNAVPSTRKGFILTENADIVTVVFMSLSFKHM